MMIKGWEGGVDVYALEPQQMFKSVEVLDGFKMSAEGFNENFTQRGGIKKSSRA